MQSSHPATGAAEAQELDASETRIVLLDCLLVLGIIVHWRLVGLWIDCLRERHGPTRRWIILAAAITISGIVGEAAAFENWRPLELGAAILTLIAFLAWVVLLLMFAVTAVRSAIRSGRKLVQVGAANRA